MDLSRSQIQFTLEQLRLPRYSLNELSVGSKIPQRTNVSRNRKIGWECVGKGYKVNAQDSRLAHAFSRYVIVTTCDNSVQFNSDDTSAEATCDSAPSQALGNDGERAVETVKLCQTTFGLTYAHICSLTVYNQKVVFSIQAFEATASQSRLSAQSQSYRYLY